MTVVSLFLTGTSLSFFFYHVSGKSDWQSILTKLFLTKQTLIIISEDNIKE